MIMTFDTNTLKEGLEREREKKRLLIPMVKIFASMTDPIRTEKKIDEMNYEYDEKDNNN